MRAFRRETLSLVRRAGRRPRAWSGRTPGKTPGRRASRRRAARTSPRAPSRFVAELRLSGLCGLRSLRGAARCFGLGRRRLCLRGRLRLRLAPGGNHRLRRLERHLRNDLDDRRNLAGLLLEAAAGLVARKDVAGLALAVEQVRIAALLAGFRDRAHREREVALLVVDAAVERAEAAAPLGDDAAVLGTAHA